VDDTLLQSYVLEAHQSHELGNLASRHLGLARSATTRSPARRVAHRLRAGGDRTRQRIRGRGCRRHLARARCAGAAACRLRQAGFVYRKIELPVAEILFRMERTGVLLDRELLAVQSGELGRRCWNSNSAPIRKPGSVQPRLASRSATSCLPEGPAGRQENPGGAPSTDEETLEQLALDHPSRERFSTTAAWPS